MTNRPVRTTRRRFLQTTAAGAAMASATIGAPALLHAKDPNEKLNVAVVGPNGRGAANLGGVMGENVVALCDIDTRLLDRAAGKVPGAKKYFDFRKMLDEMDKQIDAVVVSTPDHTHAPASVMAMKMGKHCYCEKPLAHTVSECHLMAKIAKEKKLATQMGTQIHAGGNYRRVVELVKSGAIGPIKEVHVWCGKNWGGTGDRPKDTPPVPETLKWDLWLGPAPGRPYHPCYLPGGWRRWWDFGTGTCGDMGDHYMDLPFWALDLKYPTSVEAKGPDVNKEMAAIWLEVESQFPARGDMPPVKLTWYDGRPAGSAVAKKVGRALGGNGVYFIGEKGQLFADYGRHRLYPEEDFKDFQPPEQTIPKSIGHHAEWIKACKDGSPTTCNFEYSGALSETILLGTVAFRVGKKLDWDGANCKATNSPEANKLVNKEYRKGWEL